MNGQSTPSFGQDQAQELYAVRCVIQFGDLYEERITMWRALSVELAVELCEQDARQYAASMDGKYLGLAQAFWVEGDPSEQGAEIFSLMRSSSLGQSEYLERFFTTGQECQREIAQGLPNIAEED